MPHSTTRRKASKTASKPRPDFPLFPHATHRWAKKVRGTLLYFGSTTDDPKGDKALEAWLEEKDYCLHHGRRPPKTTGKLTVEDLANRILNDKRVEVEANKLTVHTFRTWFDVCSMLIKYLGKNRHVDTVGPDDFTGLLRDKIMPRAETTRALYIGYTKSVFRYAYNEDQRLIDVPVMFGRAFKTPRLQPRAMPRLGDRRLFTAEQIRDMLAYVRRPMRAFILLAINCGFGNNDIATLTFDTLDLENGWHSHPRPKTGVARRCPLWPETIAAIRSMLELRPQPKDPADKKLVFLTHNGNPYVRIKTSKPVAEWDDDCSVFWKNSITSSMWKILTTMGIKREGLSFYTLRHSFETVAGGSKDQVAVDYIMGHVTPGMGTKYRQMIEDDRLQDVVDHVHGWLFPVAKPVDTK